MNVTVKSDVSGKRAGSVLVLLNAGSGKGDADADRRALLDRITAQDGVTVEELTPEADITDQAARGVDGGYDVIVAAGGDGTISGVSAALSGTDVKLGILPLGTFNFFTRSLGIPQDPAQAWDVISAGVSRRVSIGEINGQRFINNASIGAYPSVLKVREEVYAQWGRSRVTAYWSVIKAMSTLYRTLQLRITVDGVAHDLRSPMVFAAVRPYQLDEYGLPGAETIRDGELVVYLAPGGGRLMLLWRAVKMLTRQIDREEDYTMLTGRDVRIETFGRKRLVAWDGERGTMCDPFHLKLREDDLNVIVPEQTEDTT